MGHVRLPTARTSQGEARTRAREDGRRRAHRRRRRLRAARPLPLLPAPAERRRAYLVGPPAGNARTRRRRPRRWHGLWIRFQHRVRARTTLTPPRAAAPTHARTPRLSGGRYIFIRARAVEFVQKWRDTCFERKNDWDQARNQLVTSRASSLNHTFDPSMPPPTSSASSKTRCSRWARRYSSSKCSNEASHGDRRPGSPESSRASVRCSSGRTAPE